MNQLLTLSKQYKGQSKRAVEDGNYVRVRWLCSIQELLEAIIGVRSELEIAQQAGDFTLVTAEASKLQKLEQQLNKSLMQDISGKDTRATASKDGSSAEETMMTSIHKNLGIGNSRHSLPRGIMVTVDRKPSLQSGLDCVSSERKCLSPAERIALGSLAVA